MEFVNDTLKGGFAREPSVPCMEFIPGLNYYISTEEGYETMQKTNTKNPLMEKIDYHTEVTSIKILLENMKKLHPRLTDETEEGLAYLSVHPALTKEQRDFYRLKLEEVAKRCQEEESIQTQKLCHSQVNPPQSNTTEPSYQICDIV